MNAPLYNTIGNSYNSTRNADPYLVSRLYALLQPKEGGKYLDIGCGTGNYTIALAEKGLKMTGVDPSETMLEQAGKRNSGIKWIKGTAEALPVAEEQFDGIICVLTIHHWKDLFEAFEGLAAVLRPAGRIVLFSATQLQMTRYWLNHYFPKMMHSSIVQMPGEELFYAIRDAKLKTVHTEPYFIQDGLCDHFLYAGKNRPELYLDEVIRSGISSFAALANKAEVEKGLIMLKNDMNTGKFAAIKSDYEQRHKSNHYNEGDYIFEVLEKRESA